MRARAPTSVLAGVPQCEFRGSSTLYVVTAVVRVCLLSLSGPLCESGRVPELQRDTDAQCSKHSAGLVVAECGACPSLGSWPPATPATSHSGRC